MSRWELVTVWILRVAVLASAGFFIASGDEIAGPIYMHHSRRSRARVAAFAARVDARATAHRARQEVPCGSIRRAS